MADATYQNQVYFRRGGQAFVVASGGYIIMESGSSFYCETGFQITQAQMTNALYAQNNVVTYGSAATACTKSNIYYSAKFVRVSFASNAVQWSLWLTSSPKVGQELVIVADPGSVASGSCVISLSGCFLEYLGYSYSLMHLINSTNSAPVVHLACLADDTWSVIAHETVSVTFG